MVSQAVVVAGGKGTRLGALARKYGNKSLVPVMGKSLLYYTVDWLKKAGIKTIIVTVNYLAEFKKIRALFLGDPSVTVISNVSRISSAQCLPPIRSILDTWFLFVYGHAPVPPEHIGKLLALAKRNVVASLYTTTTQSEVTKKPTTLDGSRVILKEYSNLFIEPPYVLSRRFVNLLAQTESWKGSFYRYRGSIFGVRAHHPPEFHYHKDFIQVRNWLIARLRERQ